MFNQVQNQSILLRTDKWPEFLLKFLDCLFYYFFNAIYFDLMQIRREKKWPLIFFFYIFNFVHDARNIRGNAKKRLIFNLYIILLVKYDFLFH